VFHKQNLSENPSQVVVWSAVWLVVSPVRLFSLLAIVDEVLSVASWGEMISFSMISFSFSINLTNWLIINKKQAILYFNRFSVYTTLDYVLSLF